MTSPTTEDMDSKRIYAAAAGVSVFLGVALGVFLGVAAFFLSAGFFFCTAAAVLAGPFVILPEAVLAETFFSSTIAGAWSNRSAIVKDGWLKDHDIPLPGFSSHVWSKCLLSLLSPWAPPLPWWWTPFSARLSWRSSYLSFWVCQRSWCLQVLLL